MVVRETVDSEMKEIFHIPTNIDWLRTVIRRRSYGIESEFHFQAEQGLISVAICAVPDRKFLVGVLQIENLSIADRTSEERGWIEDERYELRSNEDHLGFATLVGPYVRWGPLANLPDELP